MMENLSKYWHYFFQKSKIKIILFSLLSIVASIVPFIVLRSMEKIINGMYSGDTEVILVYSTLIIFTYFITYTFKSIKTNIEKNVVIDAEFVWTDILERVAYYDFAKLESQKHRAKIYRFTKEPQEKLLATYFNLIDIMAESISILIIIFFIIKIDLRYVLVIAMMLFFLIFTHKKVGKLRSENYSFRKELTRREEYLNSLVFNRELAMEKNIYQFNDFIEKKIEEDYVITTKKMKSQIRTFHFAIWVYDNCVYITASLFYILLLKPLLANEITFGLYVALIPLLYQLGSTLMKMVSEKLPLLKENLDNLVMFNDIMTDWVMNEADMNIEKEILSGERNEVKKRKFSKIEIIDVEFSYDKKTPVLKGVNLTIDSGKNYAIVGKNGSGKSTLIKLILGLYEPDSGSIKIDGIDIKNMSFEEKATYMGVVFQDFPKYNLSILENITLQQSISEDEKKRLDNIIDQLDLGDFINSLDDGYNTRLGKEYENGIDLSVGQWQKISIARVLFLDKSCKIFDEPTASLDAKTESSIYRQIRNRKLKRDTEIYVTHRLGATAIMDEIIVMDEGKIVQRGDHFSLMKEKNKCYSEMYNQQKELYI